MEWRCVFCSPWLEQIRSSNLGKVKLDFLSSKVLDCSCSKAKDCFYTIVRKDILFWIIWCDVGRKQWRIFETIVTLCFFISKLLQTRTKQREVGTIRRKRDLHLKWWLGFEAWNSCHSWNGGGDIPNPLFSKSSALLSWHKAQYFQGLKQQLLHFVV